MPDSKTLRAAIDKIIVGFKSENKPALGELFTLDGVSQEGQTLYVSLLADPAKSHQLETERLAIKRAIETAWPEYTISVTLTAERQAGQNAPSSGKNASQQNRPPLRAMAQPQGVGSSKGIPGVRHIIAVASGKGGVGKSTTAVNLALALKARGARVGLMDADIYGPSLPTLLGVKGQPQAPDQKTIIPLKNYDVPVMSMGFLIPEDSAIVWRGPMVQSALTQMLYNVQWGALDILVVDMPPGTGDAQLTLAQKVPLSGAVIVSTPQDLALLDAKKAISMFRKVSVPILGLVENMSGYLCPNCGHNEPIFGTGGAQNYAKASSLQVLGTLPLDMRLRTSSDSGEPLVACDETHPITLRYLDIAEAILGQLKQKIEVK